jgi:hypothetical protein
MFRLLRILFVLAAFAASIMLISGAPAYAWQVNQHYKNLSGQTAYDMTKILVGQHTFTEAMLGQPFNNFAQLQWGGFTFGHWYNGSVAPGDYGHACFSTSSNPAPAFVALWTDINGNFIGPAGPVMGVGVAFDTAQGLAAFEIDNEWHFWTGTKYPPSGSDGLSAYVGPVTISNAAYAVNDTLLPIEKLDSTLFPTLTWHPLTDLVRTMDGGTQATQTVYLGKQPTTKAVLLRFSADGAGKHSYYVVQERCTKRPPPIPSLTNWGMAILIVLLIISAIMVFYRKKRAIA